MLRAMAEAREQALAEAAVTVLAQLDERKSARRKRGVALFDAGLLPNRVCNENEVVASGYQRDRVDVTSRSKSVAAR